jgi:hypothetical protein
MKISTILDHIDGGCTTLSDFQHGRVWNRGQARDLAWPSGIQEELSQPVAVLLNESNETIAIASQAGYRCFTDIEHFRRYVENDILAGGCC